MKTTKRKKPMNLIFFDKLKARGALPSEYKWYHSDLEHGYQHECIVDEIINSIDANWIVIRGFTNHVLFEKKFQLDLLVITRTEIIVSEIKGYRTDIYFNEQSEIVNSNGTIIDNPLEQVKVGTAKLQKLLDRLNIDLTIRYNVIVATDGGVVYGLPAGPTVLLRDQVKSHYTKIAESMIPPTKETAEKVKRLLSYNLDRSHRWPDMPEYGFDSMNKGLYFECCNQEVPPFKKYSKVVKCSNCDQKYTPLELVQKEIEDYRLFFNDTPDIPRLYEWIGRRLSLANLYNWRSQKKFK